VSSVGAFLSGVSAAAITASLGGVAPSGLMLVSYFRLYGVSEPTLMDNTVRASAATSYGVLGADEVNKVRASRVVTFAVWAP